MGYHEGAVKCYIGASQVTFDLCIALFCFQPARLNVFKNDQDTWDYTNPNLSGQGNT